LVVGGITFIERAEKNKYGTYLWVCKCYCGNIFKTVPQNIFQKTVKSCGCLFLETRDLSKTHGKSKTVLYRRWSNMHERCRSDVERIRRNYKDRGITVCEEWTHFEPFYDWAQDSGFAPNLELDRIDNNKGYSPNNCRWATRKEQSSNQRLRSNTKYITYKGETKTLKEWSDLTGLTKNNIKSRLFQGWTIERTLSTPPRK
jgi:hypothetical protein